MATVATSRHFSGFPKGGFEFFLELRARQSREWFKANKQRYEDLWENPMEALFDDLAVRLADVFPEIQQSDRKVMRIYRDTRFSPDKSPYKTHIAGHLRIHPEGAEGWGTPAVYIHFGPDDS